MLIDAHAHIDVDRPNVRTLLCGASPMDAQEVLERRNDMVIACCALHPWYAARHCVQDMMPYIAQCPVLGEIGLDSVWTDAPMEAQRSAFREQLALAEDMRKPIVLHTKGMEREIAETIAPCTVRKLVHWYSCMEHLDLYIAQDCYFTVGPDFDKNEAVQQLIRRVPMNRLLTETDGLSAVEWAIGRRAAPDEIERVLRGELQAIAQAKGMPCPEVEKMVCDNLQRFLYGN